MVGGGKRRAFPKASQRCAGRKGACNMPSLPTLVDMLKCGVHFGHKRSKRHPKMAPFIFTTKNEISIIDLQKTLECLPAALEYAAAVAQKGGVILFVGTKRQAREYIKKAAESCGMPYVNGRWLGGTLTNFSVISKMIKKYKKNKEMIETGEASKYTKKEQLDLSREIEELEEAIGGIQDMAKLPDAIFILDLKKEKTPLSEARKRGIPVIALTDTNVNPDAADYPIPANDDAVKSIEMITTLVAAAINEGRSRKAAEPAITAPHAASSETASETPSETQQAE